MTHRLEKEIEDATRKVLVAHGFVVEKNHQTTLNFGRPDLHVAHPQYGEWWIEMKRPGAKLGARQWKWMLRWEPVCNIVVCDDDAQVLNIIHTAAGRKAQEVPFLTYGQWQRWMTREQKREAATGTTPLDDAMSDWQS